MQAVLVLLLPTSRNSTPIGLRAFTNATRSAAASQVRPSESVRMRVHVRGQGEEEGRASPATGTAAPPGPCAWRFHRALSATAAGGPNGPRSSLFLLSVIAARPKGVRGFPLARARSRALKNSPLLRSPNSAQELAPYWPFHQLVNRTSLGAEPWGLVSGTRPGGPGGQWESTVN